MVNVLGLLLVYFCFSGMSLATSPVHRRASVCNGHAELCNRTFGNVSYIGAHDSYAISAGSYFANQDYNITTQLNDGIRMLQVQVHNSSGILHLCHTDCAYLDAGPFQDYLTTVKQWVVANPDEVISILIVNIDDLPPTMYDQVYKASGLDAYSYSPPSATVDGSQWPTLGSLIDQKKTVLTFMDYKANFSTVPYIIDEFSNVWETAYDVTDQTFNCAVNRTGEAGTKMYLINHFLDEDITLFGTTYQIPDRSKLNETNAVNGTGSLGLQAQQCSAQYNKFPTFLLVDFYEYGSVFQVAADLNGVTNTGNSSPPPSSTRSSTSSLTSSGSGPTHTPNNGESLVQLSPNPIVQFGGIAGGIIFGMMLSI